MSFFISILLNLICILFPMFCYLFFEMYCNSNESLNAYKKVFYEVSLMSSMFLSINYSILDKNIYMVILINIPLVFSFINNNKYFSLFCSFIIVLYYLLFLKYNLFLVIVEYLFYYIFYEFIYKKEKNTDFIILTFSLIKGFFSSFNIFFYYYSETFFYEFEKILISLVVFYLSLLFYNLLLNKFKKLININNVIKELEKEKTLKKSLFQLTHEIKNPIAVCKGYLDMININDKEKIKKYIPIIKSEIERSIVIMDDFLDYTKIKINKSIIDINYLLEDTIGSLEYLLSKNEVICDFQIDDEEYFIDGDYNRLKQVLINIIKNSIEARKSKEKLKIEIKEEVVDDNINIIISDNGVGMTKDELDKLGTIFYTTKTKGTGIGVSLSKDIIEKHNGKIFYESKKEKGTTVLIAIPLYKY